LGLIPHRITKYDGGCELERREKNASWFVFGAVIIIFSSLFGSLFARIDIRPDILREVGFGILVL
jgi:hypothetical protein